MKPTVLVATSSRWYPTARLSMALAKAGFVVDAVCPPNHPLEKTTSVTQVACLIAACGPWNHCPMRFRALYQTSSSPETILLLANCTECIRKRVHRETDGICELITRSLGCPEGFPLEYARTTFMREARAEGIQCTENGRHNEFRGVGQLDCTRGLARRAKSKRDVRRVRSQGCPHRKKGRSVG